VTPSPAPDPPRDGPLVQIRDLRFRFPGADRDALAGVTLAVDPGEFVVLAGPSGCGKSTLARAIAGFLFPQEPQAAVSGEVRVGGLDVRQQPVFETAELVGLVQQDPEDQLCTLTVRDEVAFGLENRRLPAETIRERLRWALQIVGATELEPRALATLSGGEQQKIAVAAVMACKPQVLIFDEPTSNLDPAATAEIFRVIDRIRAKADIAVIVIEHKLGYLAAHAPRLVRMEAGAVVTDGPMEAPPPPVDADPGPPPAPDDPPRVDVASLTAALDGTPVLHDISLQVRPGELVAVMGANGSGKTTLLHALIGLVRPTAGRVEVAGLDAGRARVSDLARHVGLVLQSPDHQLIADSVRDEVEATPANLGALDAATRRRVDELLREMGLEHRAGDHPHRLSHGQKRRLNLAAALAHDPRLVLLDEVLIGQDPDNAARLMGLVRRQLARGAAAVMVAHDPEVVRAHAHRLVFLDGGRVVVDAPVAEALARLVGEGHDAFVPAAAPAEDAR